MLIGDVEGDTPIHAQNLHEVVLRNVSQLNEQITRLEYNAPTVSLRIMDSYISRICLPLLVLHKANA